MTLSREDIFGGEEFLPKLVEELEEMFPHYYVTPKDNLSQVMYKAGQRDVVEYLKNKLETE